MDFSAPRRSISRLKQFVSLTYVTGSLFKTGRKKQRVGGMGHFVSQHFHGEAVCGLKKELGHTLEAQCGKMPHLGKKHYFSVQPCHCLFSE